MLRTTVLIVPNNDSSFFIIYLLGPLWLKRLIWCSALKSECPLQALVLNASFPTSSIFGEAVEFLGVGKLAEVDHQG